MEDRIGHPSVGFEVRQETLHAGVDIHSPVFVERLSPCCSTESRRVLPPTLYSQPFLSLFCEVQNLDTKGLQLASPLFQCGDLMRNRDVGKVRIDSFYNLIM